MKQNRWYMVTKGGAATLCVDEQDARDEAARADQEWPRNAPHRAELMRAGVQKGLFE